MRTRAASAAQGAGSSRDPAPSPPPKALRRASFALAISIPLIAVIIVAAVFGNGDTAATTATMIPIALGGVAIIAVLAFAVAQFVAFFNHTNLGSITAVKGAAVLSSIGLTGVPLILAFLFVSSLVPPLGLPLPLRSLLLAFECRWVPSAPLRPSLALVGDIA